MIPAWIVAPLVLLGTPTHFWFVRHGQTVANATGRYSSVTINQFSETGSREVAELTSKLLKMPRFDLILVSPSPRALNTIAPYLRRTHQKALIWPLLYECCTGRRPAGAKPTKFSYGPRVSIPSQLSALFDPIPGEDRIPNAPGYDSGLAQVRAAVQEFPRFKGKNVLLVGHSGQGGHFLHDITGRWIQLKNVELVEVR